MWNRNCQGISRRDCLQLGVKTALGIGFADLLKLQLQAADSPKGLKAKAKSCILVWLDGGPTHYETFDPKPEAPVEIRGEYHTIDTKVPGVQFSEHLKKLAGISDKFSVIRSIRHNQGNHGAGNHYMMTGAPPRIPVGCGAFVSFHPSLGSATAHARGHQNGLPSYFSMPSMTRSGGPSFLGAQYAPFVVPSDPNSKSFRVRDVALPAGLDDLRFGNRQDLRNLVDQLPRYAEKSVGDPALALDEFYSQSYDLMSSAAAQQAFDIGLEDESVRSRYGRHSFGQRALLARRLVEAGVPFVTLNEGGWDHHRDLFKTCKTRLPTLDATIATLIEDLEERGLLEETLVVVLGEFGRTPKINKDGGRDHWSNAMSVLMAGAGTPGGTVVGATDRQGYSASERVLSPENFVSTVYSKLGIDPNQILYTPLGRPTHLVSDAESISELMT
ncbi:DUF1501 domain-containing protein [Rubinisphaera sp.]|mgnify:FL=1|uniref:DUF1501 domain-containing protein n=1 Tax=Rubinisphaera sp. TaxID=2024857 RepID=UPI000C0E2A34|nr:DUF1501 domain-containing protein [Rubinisphaera sp.]MBV11784.1 hypothetical protein [Rubinisphaera sp.]HCS51171.1 DUF1501 domain-containing protein [Planctomycetaceae bacterium]|tara:strand:- start:6381 stop:7709 length:1329 start_codon:yes stop_codon:yes gene_type:complete